VPEYPSWWGDRFGDAASATVSPSQREPVYGLVADIATSPLRSGSFEGTLDEIQGYTTEVNDQRGFSMRSRSAGPTTLNGVRAEIRFQAQQLDRAASEGQLSPGEARQMKRDAAEALVQGLSDTGEQYDLGGDDIDKLIGFFLEEQDRGGRSVPGQAWASLSGVDDKTGLNRTEQKWLQAQADQESEIAWQADAKIDPALRAPARAALESGEWSPELAEAYAVSQGKDHDPQGEALEWLDENLYEPIKENVSAGAIFLDQWGDPKSDLEGSDWRTRWREARDNANDVSFGQAFVDSITQDPDENQRAYSEGFDGAGNPLDQAYFDRRQGALYNAGSGATDFAFGWFADPGVAVGKAVTLTRATARANVAAMSRPMRNRFLQIVTTPSDELAAAGQQARAWKPWEQRALRVRTRMNEVRDQVRAGKIDEFGLSKIDAFKDDPIAVQSFAEAARVKRVDPSGLSDDFDDDAFDTFVAASFGHGGARAALRDRSDGLRDLTQATERQIHGIDNDIGRVTETLDEALTDPNLTGFQAYERATQARFDLDEAVGKKDLLESQFAEYDGYNDFTQRFLRSPDSVVLRNARFSESSRMVAQTFRTSAINQRGVTITRYPRAMFMKRPGNVDLTRGSDTLEGAKRYFDQMAKYGNEVGEDGIDTLTRVAQGRDLGSWEGLKRDTFQRLMTSTNDVQRRRIMADVEDIAIETIATKHGMSADDALAISQRIKLKRNDLFGAMLRQKEETVRAGAAGEDRFTFTWGDGDNLEVMELPVSVTELANYYVPADLRSLDGLLSTHGEAIRTGFRNTRRSPGELAGEVLEGFNSYWKPSVLIRGGYPVRNVADGQLRAIALTQSLMTAAGSARALGIGTINTGSRLLNQFPRLAGKSGRIRTIKQVGTKAESTTRVRGREFPGEFAQGQADVFRSLNSSDLSQRAMYDRDLSGLRSKLSHLRATRQGEPGHVGAWAHVLNERVTKDPVWRKMLAGEDDDAIIRWLSSSTEGRALKKRIPWRGYDPTRWVDDLRTTLNTYVPDDVLRAKLAADEVIDEPYLQSLVDGGRQSPMAIDEAAIEMTQGSGALAEALGGFVDKAYHLLGTLPEDTLMRNPFFRTQYRHRLADASSSIDDSTVLTRAQQLDLAHDARQFALKQTRRYMFSLADSSDATHWFRFMSPFIGAQMESVRKWGRIFLERPESFSRLYVNGWADLDDAAWWEAVDQNGLGEEDPDHGPLESLRMQVPTSVLKKLDWIVPGDLSAALDVYAPPTDAEAPAGSTPAEADRWKKATEGYIGFDIPKRSLNVSLQGDPFFIPGAGPLVQIPVGFFAKRYPELADEQSFRGGLYRFLFPTGVPEPIDVVLPAAWQQQLRRRIMNIEDPVFTNMADNLFKQEYFAWEAGGRQGPAPDIREITDKAKLTQLYYAVARWGAPASFQIKPQGQMFIDTARQYQQEYGFEEGYARYVKEIGDEAFYFWSSNSQTNVAVPATSGGARLNKKYRSLIEEYPDLALDIVGLEAERESFNYAVYDQQSNMPTSPWDPTPRRERLTPEEAVAKAEASKGWDEWRQVNTAITAELAARGLTSDKQAGAEDLAELRRTIREALRDKYPGWDADQASFDKNRTYDLVDQHRAVINSGRAPTRGDWEGWAEYLEFHDAIAAELDARQAQGGSRSITANENSDLEILYDTLVGNLRERNLLWADAFTRSPLDNHSLVNGSN